MLLCIRTGFNRVGIMMYRHYYRNYFACAIAARKESRSSKYRDIVRYAIASYYREISPLLSRVPAFLASKIRAALLSMCRAILTRQRPQFERGDSTRGVRAGIFIRCIKRQIGPIRVNQYVTRNNTLTIIYPRRVGCTILNLATLYICILGR